MMFENVSLPEPETVSRKEWGAKEPKDKFDKLNLPVEFVWFIYDTDSTACSSFDECSASMKELQDRFMQKQRFCDLPFSFLIGGDGRVYEGRGWVGETALTQSWPQMDCNKVEIGYLGRYKKEEVPEVMRMACKQLVLSGLKHHYLSHSYYPCEFRVAGIPLNAKNWLRPDMEYVNKEFLWL